MTKKKKRDFEFYWEQPEPKQPEKELFEEPVEFKFTFPRVRFPEMRHMPVNITETDKQVVVRAELAGFKKNEINLSVTEGTIEISAAKRQEKIERGERYYREEKKTGAIRRSFTLPATVDPDRVEAQLVNGVLMVIMPKSKEVKKKKKVEVK